MPDRGNEIRLLTLVRCMHSARIGDDHTLNYKYLPIYTLGAKPSDHNNVRNTFNCMVTGSWNIVPAVVFAATRKRACVNGLDIRTALISGVLADKYLQ
jgi:hypothetical protein